LLPTLWLSVVENTCFIQPPFLWPALTTEHRSGGNSFFYFFLYLFSGFHLDCTNIGVCARQGKTDRKTPNPFKRREIPKQNRKKGLEVDRNFA
jgi:hypothetical protein